jgi:hypothetical protein
MSLQLCHLEAPKASNYKLVKEESSAKVNFRFYWARYPIWS